MSNDAKKLNLEKIEMKRENSLTGFIFVGAVVFIWAIDTVDNPVTDLTIL